MADPRRVPFGTMPDGTVVEQITLRSDGLECDIITYGGALRALRVPGRTGAPVDVVLGFDSLEDYRGQDKYIGALIGRFANRIGGARFTLNGVDYALAANDGRNHLHGGGIGFDKQVWTVLSASENQLKLALTSPDGQENYPGTLSLLVTYTLEKGGLEIDYQAESDQDTLCNLTNHAYFNLSGHASGRVEHQQVQLLADAYTPSDGESIPTGEIASVTGTPMDLRALTPIGAHVEENFVQLRQAGGYDHNWVLNGEAGTLRTVARAYAPDTGIRMEVLTTQPGIQFYTGNFLDGCPAGKDGAPYGNRWAFCLETQCYPDAPHHPNFPSAVLKKGERYHQTTIYRFEA